MDFKLTPAQWMSLVRHMLTWAGGLLVAKGLADQGLVQEVSGAILTLAGVAWAYITHQPWPPVDDPTAPSSTDKK